jgi:UDP:flavonoid glycosyltransferase YjiC (YdhE family)
LKEKETILFCVLNWGIGHATRSIPLIQNMINEGKNVEIASDGEALKLLQKEFPFLVYHTLPGYNIRYAKGRKMLWLKLGLQIPKIILNIAAEHRVIKKIARSNRYSTIISDNRPGCFYSEIKNIYITHQLRILGGIGGKIVTAAHRRMIRNFNEIWIPDDEHHSLSGRLSKWRHSPVPKRYIGHFSRLKVPGNPRKKDIDFLILLSGPEPQRSFLEKSLTGQLEKIKGNIVLVRGIATSKKFPDNFTVYNFANAELLSSLLAQTHIVICRSGYSTLMDILPFDARPILIPTPGQTEQEYLANRLYQKYNLTVVYQHQIKRINWQTINVVPWKTDNTTVR